MRKHNIRTRIDSGISTEFAQNIINISTISYIKNMLDESSLTKEEKQNSIEKIIEYIKTNYTES